MNVHWMLLCSFNRKKYLNFTCFYCYNHKAQFILLGFSVTFQHKLMCNCELEGKFYIYYYYYLFFGVFISKKVNFSDCMTNSCPVT